MCFRMNCLHTSVYGTEIMIVKLLTLRRSCAEKGSSAVNEILSLFKHLFINKEILLLGTYCSGYMSGIFIPEGSEYSESLCIYTFH